MMEIGKGSSNSIAKTIASMGANNLLVMPGTAASGGVSFGAGSILTLTAEDCDTILRDCPAVAAAAPIVRARTQVIYQDQNWVPQTIYGTTPAYLDVRDWRNLTEGEMFGPTEVRNASRVCLVGQTIVKQLFDGHSPVGKDLRIQSVTFQVVGVLSAKGAQRLRPGPRRHRPGPLDHNQIPRRRLFRRRRTGPRPEATPPPPRPQTRSSPAPSASSPPPPRLSSPTSPCPSASPTSTRSSSPPAPTPKSSRPWPRSPACYANATASAPATTTTSRSAT